MRIRACAGRNFTNVACVDAFAANQIDVRSEDAHSFPGFDFGGAQIGDVMIAIDGYPFLLQPLLVWIDVRLIWIAPRARLRILLDVASRV